MRTYNIPNSIEESIDIILNNETDFQDIGKITYSNREKELYSLYGEVRSIRKTDTVSEEKIKIKDIS